MRRDITFQSERSVCSGWLYLPDDFPVGHKLPAIVMANAISAIKEITLPGYASRFAAAGYAVLVFDYRHFGSSEGEPRNHLDPHKQHQDIFNAVTWLRAQPEIDPDRIGGWGVSLGGVHMLHAGAYDRRLKAVVSVATGLNTLETLMGRPGLQGFLRILNGDHDRRFRTGETATYMPAVSMPGQGGMMAIPEANDFYTEAMNTYAPTYENRITMESVENLITDRSADAVHLITPTPLLMIHGEKDIIPPDMVRAVFERAGEPKKLIVLDCLHTDLYVREPWITQSADAAIEWFDRYLHNKHGTTGTPQDAERNKQVVLDFYERSFKGDLDVYDELFAEDFISYSSAAGGELRGREAFRAAYIMYNKAFPDFSSTIDIVVAEDNLVFVYGISTGTHLGEFMFLPATGKSLRWSGAAIYRFNDEGLIDGRWQEFDGMGLFQQLGIIPSPDSARG